MPNFFFFCLSDKIENGDVHQRRRGTQSGISNGQEVGSRQAEEVGRTGSSWRRILLLILAITIHNIPGLSQLSGFVQETQKLWLWLRVCGWRLYCSLELNGLKVADSFLYTLSPENLQPLHTFRFAAEATWFLQLNITNVLQYRLAVHHFMH